MNQYIITEELANKLDDAIWHHGKYNRAELMLDVYSHPYNPQAERERVLDEMESRYNFLVNESGIQGFSKIMERNVLSNLLPLFRQYQELREGGE